MCSEGLGEKNTHRPKTLLVAPSGPAHPGRIPRPHPTSCAWTSWQLLAVLPPQRPAPRPEPHLSPELPGGFWRRHWARAGWPALQSLHRRDLSRRKVLSEETFGTSPSDFLTMAVLLQKFYLTLHFPHPMPSSPARQVWKKNVTKRNRQQETWLPCFLPSFKKHAHTIVIQLLVSISIELRPKAVLSSDNFLVQELSFHLRSLCSYTFSSLSILSPVFSCYQIVWGY